MENYRIRKIDAHTWQLEDPFRTYLYLIEGTERAVLLDAGNGFSGLQETIASLTDKPVSVVLTHGHFDHTGCAGLFESCSIHRADLSVLEEGFDRKAREHQVKRFAELFGVPLSREEEDYLIHVKKPEKLSFLSEGDRLELGGRTLEVIETPGHTKGGCCYYEEKEKALFSGDTIFMESIGRTDFPTGNTAQLLDSVRNKVLVLPDDVKIYPGHGPETTVAYEAANNPYA